LSTPANTAAIASLVVATQRPPVADDKELPAIDDGTSTCDERFAAPGTPLTALPGK
jgi:hypothetical protein